MKNNPSPLGSDDSLGSFSGAKCSHEYPFSSPGYNDKGMLNIRCDACKKIIAEILQETKTEAQKLI